MRDLSAARWWSRSFVLPGLWDPAVTVKPVRGQVDDLIGEIRRTVDDGYRVLVTTLTKRMAEDLTDYLREIGIRVRYLHSEIVTLERVEILRGAEAGRFRCACWNQLAQRRVGPS